jgi:hypothetical protein
LGLIGIKKLTSVAIAFVVITTATRISPTTASTTSTLKYNGVSYGSKSKEN